MPEKETTALMQLIEQLKKLSPNPGDNDVSKAYHEGIQWAILKATSLLPVEKEQHRQTYTDGAGSSTLFDKYFSQKFTQ